jgi:hypothetical protein
LAAQAILLDSPANPDNRYFSQTIPLFGRCAEYTHSVLVQRRFALPTPFMTQKRYASALRLPHGVSPRAFDARRIVPRRLDTALHETRWNFPSPRRSDGDVREAEQIVVVVQK